MARDASQVLGLTPIAARQQWGTIRQRNPPVLGTRQGPFLPVEDVLCFALFDLIAPNAFGGSNLSKLPAEVQALGACMRRPVTSLLEKMRNLAGIRPNGQRADAEIFIALTDDAARASALTSMALQGALEAGYTHDELPSLEALRPRALQGQLLGQDELSSQHLEQALRERSEERPKLAEGYNLDVASTERLILATVRKGQDRFAAGVMRNFGYACGFCGLTDPVGAVRTLLRASHIKPWSECAPKERLDRRNGIAACANHDAAFDSGLLAVNGGLKIHRAPTLAPWIEAHAAARAAFGPQAMHERLLLGPDGVAPEGRYLRYHGEKWGWLHVG